MHHCQCKSCAVSNEEDASLLYAATRESLVKVSSFVVRNLCRLDIEARLTHWGSSESCTERNNNRYRTRHAKVKLVSRFQNRHRRRDSQCKSFSARLQQIVNFLAFVGLPPTSCPMSECEAFVRSGCVRVATETFPGPPVLVPYLLASAASVDAAEALYQAMPEFRE